MPRIIQIIDCDSSGHKVRMDDGEFAFLPHDPGCVPCVGEDLTRDPDTGKWSLTPCRADAPAADPAPEA